MGGRKEGTLNKETIIKLERRARFDEKVAEKWDGIIDKLIEEEPRYVADQIMDKARERVDVTSGGEKIETGINLTDEVVGEVIKEMKRRDREKPNE